MCDALPGVSKTDVGEMVMRSRLIRGDLTAEKDGETRIGLDDDVQLPPRDGVHAHHREATGGVIHRGVRRRLKPQDRTRKCKIQNLAGAVVKKHGEGDPAIENNEVCGTDFALAIELRSDRDDPSTCLQIGDRAELSSYWHLVSPLDRRTSRR